MHTGFVSYLLFKQYFFTTLVLKHKSKCFFVQVLEAQKFHRAQKYGNVPEGTTPYTYDKVCSWILYFWYF